MSSLMTSRIVVVSGGGTGIGRAVAGRFAREGDQVVVVGRRQEVLGETAHAIRGLAPDAPAVHVLPGDLTEVGEAERVRDEVAERHGRVDVLVNNAGGNAEIGAPAEKTSGVSGAAWRWTENFRLNVLTTVLLTEGLKELLAPSGRVLLMSSIAAFRGSGTGSYAAVKAALHPYAFDLASELGPRGITVNVVAPGFIDDTEFFRGGMSDQRREFLTGQTNTGRVGTPDDVAETAFWLSSQQAGHVTAQIVQVNGGALAGR
jgi:3-oxoacyl-[acyl-carrier protein] reductase